MKQFLYLYHKKILLSLLFLVASTYSFISITTHIHFLTFGWDLGFFDQYIWKLSRFIYPLSSLNKVNILANHFSPILFFYTPLYWLWTDVRMLLIAQSFVVVFSAYPLYLLAYSKTKNIFFSYSIVFSYLFFLGTQWSILNEFHELTAAPLFISLAYLGLEKKRNVLFWLGILGLLITKEEMSLLVSSIGLTTALYFKRKKLGYSLMIASLIFFFFLVLVFMPAISEKGAYQHSHLDKVFNTPSEFTWKLFTDPTFALKNLITPTEKIRTLVVSFLSFGLIPLLAPIPILIPIIEQFLMRFLYAGGQFTVWVNVNHHAAPIAMLFPIACIYAVYSLINKYKNKKKSIIIVLSLTLIIATISQDILLKAPIHSLFKKQFYENYQWMDDNRIILSEVLKLSPTGLIAVQNSLYPHLSQRKDIYLLPEIKDSEYLVVDFHDGPNKYAPLQKNQMVEVINKLVSSGEFKVYKRQGEVMILSRSYK